MEKTKEKLINEWIVFKNGLTEDEFNDYIKQAKSQARKEVIEEELSFLTFLLTDYPNRDRLIHRRIKELEKKER